MSVDGILANELGIYQGILRVGATVDLRLDSEKKVLIVRILKNFCGHIFKRSKLTQKNEIFKIFCPRIFEKLQKEILKYTVGYLPEKWIF